MIFTSCIQVTSAFSLSQNLIHLLSLPSTHVPHHSLASHSGPTQKDYLAWSREWVTIVAMMTSVSSSLLVYISFVIKISFESRRNSTRQQGRVKAAYAYLFIYWLGRRRSHGRSEHLAWRVISSNSLILNTKRPCKVIFVTPTTGLTDNLTQRSVQRMETNS